MTSPLLNTRHCAKFHLDIEALIKEVHYRPAIWNKNCDRYTDRRLKARMWEEVCENVIENWKKLKILQKNAISGEVQKKWRNVKDAFKKEVQIQKKISAGLEVRRKRQYIHYKALSFLANDEAYNSSSAISPEESDDESDNTSIDQDNTSTSSTRKRTSNKNVDEDEVIIKREKFNFDDEYSNSEHNKQNVDNNEDKLLVIELDKSDFAEENAGFVHKKVQRREKYPDRHFVEIKCDDWDNDEHSHMVPKKDQDNKGSDSDKIYDEDISFTEMMVPMLRRLNDDQKYYAKIEILNILHKARRHHSPSSAETQTEQLTGPEPGSNVKITDFFTNEH